MINFAQNRGHDLVEAALKSNQWNVKEVAGLTLIESPLLSQYGDKLTHAFTTRLGGESAAPYSDFNLGRHVPDESLKQDALRNRARLCQALGANHDYLKVPGQVHSGNVVAIYQQEANPDLAQVDGVSTNLPDVPLLLHFADCVPVIIYETKNNLVAIVHAGWRGTAQAIGVNAVRLMVREWGADVSQMVAAVGPAIGTCCYPTGEDVVEQLMLTLSSSHDDNLKLVDRAGEQPRPDLKAINAMQLLLAGVAEVDVCSFCTACKPEIFYSHRQSGGKTGRQGAMAMMRQSSTNRA